VASHRLQWSELPRELRGEIERAVDGRVVSAVSGRGGYSPSFASRCRLDDGRAVFVKAVSSDQNPDSPRMLRREIDVTRALPPTVPAPRLLDALDDDHWVVGVFEYVQGRPPAVPWNPRELDRVLAAMPQIGDAELSDELRALLPRAERDMEGLFDKWALISDVGPPSGDPWAVANLDALVALEAGWRAAVEGDALVHNDIRSDNVLFESSDRVVFVDWPHARIGAPWVDVVWMLPSVAMEGGGEPDDVLQQSGVVADAAEVDALVAAMAGFFAWQAMQPDPPGLPTLRAFQRAQGEVTMRWLRSRLGDPEPQ
jgi:aminoglycoside phosphotransferase (APT) family kinase protein